MDRYCAKIKPVKPEVQDKFYGKYICGLRGGLPFKSVLRLNPNTKKCPTGTSRCSSKTNDDNTVCYKDLSLCPVTQIVFAAPTSKLNTLVHTIPFTKQKSLF